MKRGSNRNGRGIAGWMLCVGLGVAGNAQATVFNVTNLNDNGGGSVRDAIDQANSAAGADVIEFQPGLQGTITLTTGMLAITDSDGLSIIGNGAGRTIISGNNSGRVFDVVSGAERCFLWGGQREQRQPQR